MNPLVSVVLPTHNRSQYIKKAIESVLNQTFENFELIIVDDMSTDQTPQIIFDFAKKDSRVKVVRNNENLGMVKSLNKAIRQAKGIYIARIDDDDCWFDSKKLEKQLNFLESNKDYVLVGGGVIRVDGDGKEIVKHILPEKDEDIRRMILLDNTFVHSSVMFRKNIYDDIGGYDENLPYTEDWDLWMKFGKKGKMYNFQDYFVRYLWAGQNMSILKIKRNLKLCIQTRKEYKNDYPNYLRGFFWGWSYYIFVLLTPPFLLNGWPRFFLSKIRRIIFGEPVYKSF